jgi:hypothetical protein
MESEKFKAEIDLIKSVLEPEEILEIQQTAEDDTSLDMLLIVTPDEYIQAYVRPLGRIGYKFYPEDSSIIKLYFQKGDTFKYNLYLTQAN